MKHLLVLWETKTGLGTAVNLDTAYAYFVTAASSNDPLGHNGLGYIYFRGTNAQAVSSNLVKQGETSEIFGGELFWFGQMRANIQACGKSLRTW